MIKFREIDTSSHRVRFSLLQEKATLAYLNFHKLYDRLWSSLGEPRSAISDQTLTQRVRDKKEGKNLYIKRDAAGFSG